MVNALNNMEEFKEVFKKCEINRLIIMFYTATWCGPCKFMYPLIEELVVRVPHISIYKIDVDNDGEEESEKISTVNDVESMPTFHFYKNGNMVDKLSGANKIELLQKIKIHSLII